jgi:hypothetical protein
MKFIHIASSIAALAICCTPALSLSQSFSDTNRPLFRKMTKPPSIQQQTNPFAQGISSPRDLSVEDLQLMGVVVGHDKSYALVNGYVVERGDRIAGFEVKSIGHSQVVLRRLEEVFILRMGGGA